MHRVRIWRELIILRPTRPISDTLFKQVGYVVSGLVDSIQRGHIGLPDLQRPFVWKDAKVRDLFDSMYRGYPVGYLLFWQNALAEGPGRSAPARSRQFHSC